MPICFKHKCEFGDMLQGCACAGKRMPEEFLRVDHPDGTQVRYDEMSPEFKHVLDQAYEVKHLVRYLMLNGVHPSDCRTLISDMAGIFTELEVAEINERKRAAGGGS